MNKIPTKNQVHELKSSSDFGLLKPAYMSVKKSGIAAAILEQVVLFVGSSRATR